MISFYAVMLRMCRLYQVIKHKQAIISDWVVSVIFFLYTSLIYYASVCHKYYVIDGVSYGSKLCFMLAF